MLVERYLIKPLKDMTLLRNVISVLLAIVFLSTAIHIVAVLLVPRFASEDGWSRLDAFAEPGRFKPIPNDANSALLPGLDPMFVHSACSISLAEAPGILSLSAQDRFWSLALYDSNSIAIFSLNDRTAQDGTLDMLVVNSVQNALLKENPPDDIDDIIVVEAQDNNLIAVFRLYSPTAELRRLAMEAIGSAICEADL